MARDIAGQDGWQAVTIRRVAERVEMKGKLIVVIIPSFGERYLSTALYAPLFEENQQQAI